MEPTVEENTIQIMWKIGDIIQIDPEKDPTFGACFMVVTEPKSWGAQGYFQAPGQEGLAYYRCPFDRGVRVGHTEWVAQYALDEDETSDD